MATPVLRLPSASPVIAARTETVPWYIYALLLASTTIIMGIMWDISWHRSIGRDTFWTPAHLAIYLGGLVAAIACGWLVLRTTFAGSAAERGAAVRFWGFRGPLGAWVVIWGTFAMLASAPFDDWWHNAYGLDVEILSPPHVVLALGIVAIQLGALLMVLARQNNARDALATDPDAATLLEAPRRSTSALLYGYSAGILLLMVATVVLERTLRIYMHGSGFYITACIAFPIVLVATARASTLRWPATTAAIVYTALTLVMVWVLPLFPAETKLGPIYYPIDHFVANPFPLLLIAPAIAVDLVMRRFGNERSWLLAIVLGIVFFDVFLLVQWFFAEFLMSPLSRNWVFATADFDFATRSDYYVYRHEFLPTDANEAAVRNGLFRAMLIAVISAGAGLLWGNWMRRVRR